MVLDSTQYSDNTFSFTNMAGSMICTNIAYTFVKGGERKGGGRERDERGREGNERGREREGEGEEEGERQVSQSEVHNVKH